MSPPSTTSVPLTVLVIGANGYLGSAICNAFLRTAAPDGQRYFRVYGLVRRDSAARHLAMSEVLPIVGQLSEREGLRQIITSHSPKWDVIITCTEPSRTDEAQHWDDLLALVQGLARESTARGVRPLVLWSSGCKDYGMTGLDGDQDLAPHTETSPLQEHPIIRGRMGAALRAIEIAGAEGGVAGFDVAIVRATPVFGYSGSYYGAGFEYVAAYAAAMKGEKDAANRVLKFTANAGTIIHGLHIDDCAEGYVALASTALGTEDGRRAVAGQVFNLSGRKYETLREVGTALAREYGFDGGVGFGVAVEDLPTAVSGRNCDLTFGWSQWVSSDKIRKVTGWGDWRPLFAENTHIYRLAFEAAAEAKVDDVDKVRRRMAGNWADTN
ncbi:hypothetical protein P885DRAFT_82214 [Corynascus similis CBS 632.67]